MNALWAVFGTVLSALLLVVVEWLKAGQERRTGAAAEAGKVSAVAAVKEAAVAQAVVAAPTTRLAVIDQLKQGTF